ncbi:serine protease [Candidatus Kaiserbacteria bacterium]|nr:serine protease [Candidatus Kaiserbacteria bacterium]
MQNAGSELPLRFGILFVLFLAIGLLVINPPSPASVPAVATSTASTAAAAASGETSATTTPVAKSTATSSPQSSKKPISEAIKSTSPLVATNTAERIPKPYPTAPLPLAAVNDATRAAIVNILCTTPTGLVRPISGSGVIISPRGVILTNAHVAQYVLLAESARVNLECFVRTGSPAHIRWIPRVLYLPPVWIEEHASEITTDHPLGTGEHDYALLFIAGSADDNPLPTDYPYLTADVRRNIGFVDDSVLAAGYPAEFIGGLAATNDLYSASSATTIKKLFTFGTNSVDVLSLGGIIVAQSGSSGGAAVNMWGYLIGLITTTSEGTTTANRDLRAITLSYINRDITAQTGADLQAILNGDPALETEDFSTRAAPDLVTQLLKILFK